VPPFQLRDVSVARRTSSPLTVPGSGAPDWLEPVDGTARSRVFRATYRHIEEDAVAARRSRDYETVGAPRDRRIADASNAPLLR
jgi:hypothetical protein